MQNLNLKRSTENCEVSSGGKALIKGNFVAYTITIMVFLIYAILLTYTEMTEKNTQVIVMTTTVISMLFSGFISARGFKSKGLFYGMVAGLIYAVIMILVGLCILPVIAITSKFIIILILSVSAGGVGGILGINTKKKWPSVYI